jgi:hypothetical protein
MDTPNGRVDLLPGEKERIDAALLELKKDPHAPNELSVKVSLHVHNEYPKAIGDKVVNSEAEELELALEGAAKAQAAAPATIAPESPDQTPASE